MSDLDEPWEKETEVTTYRRETSVALQSLMTASISSLAAQLAQQAGEATERPLTEAQLDWAWQVMRAERNALMRLVRRDLGWPTS